MLCACAVACGVRRADVVDPAPVRRTERGLASWYGKPFHGRVTASGERYDMHALTAAHRTLPFNTHVRVRRLDTGRTVRVRITDRGPFVEGRIIDLSFAAARELRMIEAGVVQVEVVVLR